MIQANDGTLCAAGSAGSLWPTELWKARRIPGAPKKSIGSRRLCAGRRVADAAASHMGAWSASLKQLRV